MNGSDNITEGEITISGPGGIRQTRTREQLDQEANDILKKKNKKPFVSRFRVTPTSADVDQSAVSKLVSRIRRGGGS